ncbi:MAG TPA: hypothetical protein VJI70_01865 [Candidatus Paceibacterota bacterium]
MPTNMEGSMNDKQRLEEALKNADASHAKLMREHPEFVTAPPKTLEELFGPEKAAEMRREAARLRRQDGNID